MLTLNAKLILSKSLGSGINMKFNDFVRFNGIGLNESYVDAFFHNLKSDAPIYMSESTISYFGYQGTIRDQKKALNLIITNNFLDYKGQLYFEYNNAEYIDFRKEKEELLSGENSPDNKIDKLYPQALQTRGKTNTKHLLITPRLFKEILMLCNTEKGKQVRRFYLDIVEVMELYIQYQNSMTITSLEQKLDNITLKLVKSDQKADERFKKAEEGRQKAEERSQKAEERHNKLMDRTETIQESLEESKDEILEKIVELAETKQDLTNVTKDRVATKRVPKDRYNHIVILKDDDCTEDEPPYYILRTQEKSITSRIATLKKKYPAIKEIFRIYTPNATSAWISICDKYKPNISKSVTPNWFFLTNTTEARFKSNLMKMDTTERQNPKFI